MGLASWPQLPPLDVKSVTIIMMKESKHYGQQCWLLVASIQFHLIFVMTMVRTRLPFLCTNLLIAEAPHKRT